MDGGAGADDVTDLLLVDLATDALHLASPVGVAGQRPLQLLVVIHADDHETVQGRCVKLVAANVLAVSAATEGVGSSNHSEVRVALGGFSVTREVAVAVGQGSVEGHDRLGHGGVHFIEEEQATVGVGIAESGGDNASLSVDETAELVLRSHGTSEVEAQVQSLGHLLTDGGLARACRANQHHGHFSSNCFEHRVKLLVNKLGAQGLLASGESDDDVLLSRLVSVLLDESDDILL